MTKHLTLLLFIGLAWGQTDLSIKEEAVLDAKRDAKKWLAYPPLALISGGGFATATFFMAEHIYDGYILLPLIIGGGSLGIVGLFYFYIRNQERSRNNQKIKFTSKYKN